MYDLNHASPPALSVTTSSPPSTSSTSTAPAGPSPLPDDLHMVLHSPSTQMSMVPPSRARRALQVDKSPWTMIEASQEPNADDVHPDLDRTKIIHLSRLIALMQCGWTVTRGRGPRNHAFCLWCRGPLTDHTEILVHSCDPGASSKCNNAWPASCFMKQFINFELKAPGRKSILCPMCRGLIIRTKISLLSASALTSDFDPPEKNKAYPALVRIMFFSAEKALQEPETNTKGVFVMERSEVAKLAKLGRNKVLFESIDAIKHLQRCTEHLFDSWLVINCGDNEYRLTPLIQSEKDGPNPYGEAMAICRQKCVTAEKLEEEAANNGGLDKAVAAFRPDFDEGVKQMISAGKEELAKILDQWIMQEPNVEVRQSQRKAYFKSLKNVFAIIESSNNLRRKKSTAGGHAPLPPIEQSGGNAHLLFMTQIQDDGEQAGPSAGMSIEDSDDDDDEDEDEDIEESQEGEDAEEGGGDWDMM
ncbi:hypothetical protein RBB50_008490 [Rhinocladiella similis]